ncbi:HTH-type transcriptional regulator GntR [Undibacterium oligocarboniphilum]|uniref:LacI family DNA-binding transcriptional regulator n=1 Tax=Undibacterium oligocarboniphilum TaxID=666702 RepID=A0A850QFK9_9BURK|nr:LacI family DNA-binding transcriptional regulator [Undibacterium oligocarboniphilum]MBC3869348.1 LacI family DNA-binding transcriptional regulator [Undibacterium oligocarboniphilum]NVO77727.1 LacI family DNA-binding transcriptional regulator [Undibacterium oligocarboniphilum]
MSKIQTAKGRASGKITLAEVAARAGVASMTASRAISQPERVSASLRERVEQAVAELGYVPNRAARALASAQSNVIAVLVPSLSNAVFTEVLAGIQDVLDADNYQLLIGNTRYSDAEEEKLLGIYLQSNPDGILLSGMTHSPRVEQMLQASQIPVVSMMDLAESGQAFAVGFSQFQAGYTMTRYLLDKGHRRIGFMGAQLDERTLKRAEGYRKAMRESGLENNRLEVMVSDPSTIALGAELLGRMLSVAPDCDAIFCCNDDLAHGAIYQCQRRGIAVPDQIAICGFNDLPASAWMKPSVTTISTPRYRIGFEAASLLRALIRKEAVPQTQIDLGFTLMARESA